MLGQLLLLGYAGAVGFVAAGIVASFYKMLTSEPARFVLLGKGVIAAASTFLFCALTGPVIVLDHAIRARQSDQYPLVVLLGGLFIAALWSCCSGILVLGLVLAI